MMPLKNMSPQDLINHFKTHCKFYSLHAHLKIEGTHIMRSTFQTPKSMGLSFVNDRYINNFRDKLDM